MNIFRQAIEHYSKRPYISWITVFAIVGLTLLYGYFIGQHHLDNILLSYLVPWILLVVGGPCLIIAYFFAIFWRRFTYLFLYGLYSLLLSLVGFVVTFILFIFV